MLAKTAIQALASIRCADRFVLLVLAVSLSANVFLAGRYLAVQEAASPISVQPGERLPPLKAKGLDGGERQLRYDDDARPTVVYVFSPSCAWCARNYANITQLAHLSSASYRLVALALSDDSTDVAAYLHRYPLGFDVLFGPSPDTRRAFHLGGTPETFVIDSHTVVLAHWRGAFTGPLLKQVEAFFGVALPGLLPNPQSSGLPTSVEGPNPRAWPRRS